MSQLSSSQPDLMGMVKRQITPDVIRSVSSRLGEDRGRTASAIDASVPSVLTAFSDVASTETGAAHLKEAIDERRRRSAGTRPDTAALLSPGDGWAADRGAGFIDGELGKRANTLSDAVADSSGIRRDSAHKLMGGVASVAVSALASTVGGMGSGGLQTLFREQRGDWVKQLPGSMAPLFNGHGRTLTTERRVYEERVTGPAVRRLEQPRRGWLIPLIVLALALLAIPLIRSLRRPSVAVRPQPEVTHTLPPAQTAPAPATPPTAPPVQTAPAPEPATPPPAAATAPAPSAAEQTPPPAASAVTAPGNAQDMAAFLNGTAATPQTFAPKPLNFTSGSATLTQSSEGTLDDIAATLKDHPAATIRLESFTDNVGTPESNLDLSTARSESVKEGLMQRGVAGENIDTAGRGQARPIASNDTAEGRAQNRRTEIVVTNK